MNWLCVDGVWQDGAGKPIETAPMQVHERSNSKIPMRVAEEAYKEYAAQYGYAQSLNRLNERGGFGAAELAILLYERIKRIES